MPGIARNLCLTALVLALAVSSVGAVFAQDLHPSRRPSPMSTSRIMVGDTYISVHYSAPYKRNRDNIFGTEESEALVPYGEIWRTGANEATEITLTGDVMVGGEALPAGTYSIFTVPGAESWAIHFNSKLGLNGTGTFNFETRKFTPHDIPSTDVLVVTADVGSLEEELDQFKIALGEMDGGADLCFRWITTEVCVPIQVQ